MSTYLEENYSRWFVYEAYTYAGAPKMEDALMTWASVNYLHCIIAGDSLDTIVEKIQAKQEELWNENKRLKKVSVSLSKPGGFDTGLRRIYIGHQQLVLRKVKDEIL